eukprot:g1577.t1
MDPLERDVNGRKGDDSVSLNAFAFLFSAVVQYFYSRSKSGDIEDKLFEAGADIGERLNELTSLRELGQHHRIVGNAAKEGCILGAIQYIHTNCWKVIFGRHADKVDRASSTSSGSIQYMITENNPIVNRYIPGDFNCASYIAGIIFGILKGLNFKTKVKHFHRPDETYPGRTVYLIEFITRKVE